MGYKSNSTNTILMIRPYAFGKNIETSKDNKFQQKTNLNLDEIKEQAHTEFDNYVNLLKQSGINVIVLEDSPSPVKPDAIFPNNWFSTTHSGKFILYPMKAEKRRVERENNVFELLQKEFDINETIDFSHYEKEHIFLEGTGSIVFDHQNDLAFMSLSDRTHKKLGHEVMEKLNKTAIFFEAHDRNGFPIYHTNVVMSVTSDFIIICLDAISSNKDLLLKNLKSTNKKIIEISFDQMENFCGNILEVTGRQKNITMSTKSFKAFSEKQIKLMQEKAHIIHSPLDTIESVGGGGSRCMMAEIFLSKI